MQGRKNTSGSKRGKQSVRRKCCKETVLLQSHHLSDFDMTAGPTSSSDSRSEGFDWWLELEDKTTTAYKNRNWKGNETAKDLYPELGERRHFTSRNLSSLIIHGIPEIEKETPEQTEQVIKELLETLKIGKISISNARRIIKQGPAATCPILLTLVSTGDKDKILKARRILKKSSITVQKVRTAEGRRRYEMLKAFAIDNKKKNPSAKYFIRNSKLYINNLEQMMTYTVNGSEILGTPVPTNT